MTAMMTIHGRKGGSKKPKAPTEAPDNLQSVATAKILLAVGEGEFAGTPTARDIYLDNTPLADASGNLNFPGVKWEWRPGSIDQEHIPGIPSVENDTQLNIELRSDTPFVRSITNTQLSAVRLRFAWPGLQRQDDKGNVGGYRIEYAVDVATDGGTYVEVLRDAVDGKTTTRYERSRRIDLPAADSGWQIRVRRLTANANNNRIADTMLIAGLAEVIDAKIQYRNTALLFVEFSAEQFTNIPAVTVDCKARKWPVPSNYDPETRTYTGIWDGSFKEAWTNNPAWITYGLCVNDRFGLGRRIKSWMVDKWELYRIAQYCDQLVPDGKGGQEPRFLCDMNLQAKAEAWALLRDIAAIYRGMTYWAQGQLMSQADMPRAQDFDYVFTRANVVDGKFAYGSASARTRYSRALVSYDNPANNYDTDVAAVTDKRLQRRYRDNPVEISAIGCTRESEAQRRGKWLLMSNSQDRTVVFSTGMEGRIPLPGYVIPVADSLLAGREVGGRIRSVEGRVITLDRDTQAKLGDRLIINLPSGTAEGRTIQAVNGRQVTVTTAYNEIPEPQLVWALDADDLAIQLYRVMKTARNAQGDYEITALQYEPSKFAHIDTGAKLESRPISVIPVGTIDPPASVEISAFHTIDQGIAIHTMTIAWPSVSGAVAYDVEWRKDSGNWVRVPRTGALGVDVPGIYAGGYVARVRAVSAWDIASIYRESILTHLQGKEGAPPAIAYLSTTPLVFGIRLDWGFPEGAEDTQRTEIQYSTAPSEENVLHLGDYAYPSDTHTMTGLAAAVRFFFRARLVDRTGNIGPWSDWVMGQSSADADEILDYIAGQIGESQLDQNMREEIDKISGDGPGSVNERVGELNDELESSVGDLNASIEDVDSRLTGRIESVAGDIAGLGSSISDLYDQVGELDGDLQSSVSDLNSQLAQLETQIADITGAEDWLPGQAYLAGTLVRFDGALYRAEQDVPAGTPVTDELYWRKVGDYASIGEAVAALAIQVTDMQLQVDEINGTQSSIIETTNALIATTRPERADGEKADSLRGWETQASITQRDRVEASDKEALAQRLLVIDAQIGDTSAQLSTLQQAFASESEATAGRLDQLAVELGDTAAGLQQEIQTRATETAALASDVQSMQATLEGVATSEALQALAVEVEQLDGNITSMAQSVASLTGRIEDTETGLQVMSEAVSGLQTSVSSIEGELLAQASDITALGVSVGQAADLAGQADGKADDALQGLGDKADASAVQGLTVQVQQMGEDVTANSGAITQLGGRLESAESGIAGNADAVESLTTDVELIDGKVTAAAEQASRLSAELRPERADGEKADSLRGWKSQASITESSRVSASEREVLAERLFAAEVQMGEANANLAILEQAFADESEATASQLTSLSSEIGTTSSALSQEISTRASETAALAQDVQALQVALGDVASVDALAALVTEVEELEGRVTASAQDIVSLSASLAQAIDDIATKADSTAVQALQSTVTQQGEQITATSQSVTDLEATVNDEISAAVQSLQQAVADESSARAQDINTVQAEIGTVADQAQGAQSAADQAAQEASTATAAVQQTSEALVDLEGNLSALHTIKAQTTVDGHTVMAGIAVGVEGEEQESQVLVYAQRFAVVDEVTGKLTPVFVVEGGQIIANHAIFKQADIINLIVTGALQSPDYVAGQTGVRVNFVTGEFEMNGQLGGGWRHSVNNEGSYVWEPGEPLPVVEMGKFIQ